jgi:hypothetical protein
MGEIVLEPGDQQRIVSQPGRDEAYNINVEGATVFLSHRSNGIVREGKRVKAGDRTQASNLRGKPLFAKNPGSNSSEATIEVDQAGFALNFMTRPVVGAVRTTSGNEAAPANDNFVHLVGTGRDVSSNPVSETFEAPDAADDVLISVDDADNTFEVAVVFEDADGNEVTRRDSNNSGEYSGSSSTDVFVETLIASPHVTVEVSGAATSLDYSVYAR